MAEKKVEASLRSYVPSLKEKLYQALAGTEQRPTAERASFARGLSDLAEFMPFLGNVLAGEEAYRRGDNKGMAMAMLPVPGARAPHRIPFDENMFQAYLRRKFRLNAPQSVGPIIGEGGENTARMMGMGYSAEDLGQAVVPYRQGGLVYEPVGPQAGLRQIGGPGMEQRLGYGRGPIEGEFSDVYGIAGPRTGSAMTAGPMPYSGSMDFGVTREGMAVPPSGMMFDPRVAAGATGLGYLAGLPGERETKAQADEQPVDLTFNPDIPIPSDRGVYSKAGLGPVLPQTMESYSGIQPTYRNPFTYGPPSGATALSGQPPGAGTAFEAPRRTTTKSKPKSAPRRQEARAGGAGEAEFEPNFNYLVTQAIDNLLGRKKPESERGRQFQEYYATHPWPY